MKTACQVLLILLSAIKTSLGADAVDLFDRLKAKLPPGWSATRSRNRHRHPPRTAARSLQPGVSASRRGAIEKIKQPHNYRLHVTCKPKISSEELKRLEDENAKTEKEIKDMQEKMREFREKGDNDYWPSHAAAEEPVRGLQSEAANASLQRIAGRKVWRIDSFLWKAIFPSVTSRSMTHETNSIACRPLRRCFPSSSWWSPLLYSTLARTRN